MRLADGRTLGILGTAALCLMCAGTSTADDFYLANGKTVRGALISESDAEYVLRTEMGTIKLKKQDVSRRVSAGTTEAEISGDSAAGKGKHTDALNFYRQALNAAGNDASIRQRIEGKISQVNALTTRATAGETSAQFQQAKQLIESGQFEAADTIIGRIVTQVSPQDPMSSEIRKMQAQVYYGKGVAARDVARSETAQLELQRAIDTDPQFYPAYLALGEGMLGNSASARRGVENIEKGLEIGGSRVQEQQRYNYQYMVARKYFELGDYAKAASGYAGLIPVKDKYPAYSDSLDKAVDSYVRMGEENLTSNFQETINNLNVALKLNPENEKALFLLGRIYLDRGQIENAVITLKNLVSLNRSYAEANHYLGKAYFLMKDYGLAMQHLTAEIANTPGNYRTLVDRAEVQIAMKNFAGADSDLKSARVLDDKDWYSYYLGGLLALAQDDYNKARAELTSALDRNRSAVPVHLLMGKVLMEQNENEAARKWFEQVANSLGNMDNLNFRYRQYRTEALTNMGLMAIMENNPRQAITVLNEALATIPDYSPALIALADADLIMANDASAEKSRGEYYDEAEKLYQTAAKKDPNNPEVYQKLGSFYHKYKVNNEQAIANFNLYVDKGGRDARVNGWLLEVGGTARPEIAPPAPLPTAVATTGTLTTTGTLETTGAMMMPGAPSALTTATGSISTATLEAASMAAPAVPGSPAIQVAPVPVAP